MASYNSKITTIRAIDRNQCLHVVGLCLKIQNEGDRGSTVGLLNQQNRSNDPAEEELGYPAVINSDCHCVSIGLDGIGYVDLKWLSPGLFF